jgi:hypothetical protein
MMVLVMALMLSCFSLPALALNQTNVSAAEFEANDDGVARAPEYIRIKNTNGYRCYLDYGKTFAEGGSVLCFVRTGDYLLFLDGKYDTQGRFWVKGQIQGSHDWYGQPVWLLWDSSYMGIGY